MFEAICNGCIHCCSNFVLTRETVGVVAESHPGLLSVLGPIGDSGSLLSVRCNEAIEGFGCGIHPSLQGGEDTRPAFCSVPSPHTCGHGTFLIDGLEF